MNRRLFLKSLGGVGLSLVVPTPEALASVIPPPVPLPFIDVSSLFAVQPMTNPTGLLYYLKFKLTDKSKTPFKDEPVVGVHFTTEQIASLQIVSHAVDRDAVLETDPIDLLMDQALPFERLYKPGQRTNCDRFDCTILDMNRAANDIGRSTRRGVGNWALTHPANKDVVNGWDTPDGFTRKIIFHEDYRLLNRIFIGYKGPNNVDSAIIAITENDGNNKFVVAEDVPSYYRRIDL